MSSINTILYFHITFENVFVKITNDKRENDIS